MLPGERRSSEAECRAGPIHSHQVRVCPDVTALTVVTLVAHWQSGTVAIFKFIPPSQFLPNFTL